MSNHHSNILIVDDEPDNRNIIAEYLDDKDYTFTMAEDGSIAWEILQEKPDTFKVILLDIMMPNMNGLELLTLIKNHAVLNSIPVILQTAKGSSEDIAKGIQAGAFYYLTKPFNEDVLVSIIETAISDHQRFQSLRDKVDKGAEMVGMMKSSKFEFKSLSEGNTLLEFISQACPEPGKVVLGLSELLINAVEHGNLGISYQLKSKLLESGTWQQEVEKRLTLDEYANRFVEVTFNRHEDQIIFSITDQGDGFDWKPYLQIDANRAADRHGRGIAMAGLMSFDSIEYKGTGNQVVATINL